MTAAPEATPERLRVKRDGPRGWHWIAAANYNPAVHVLIDDEKPAPAVTETKKQGRTKKSQE